MIWHSEDTSDSAHIDRCALLEVTSGCQSASN